MLCIHAVYTAEQLQTYCIYVERGRGIQTDALDLQSITSVAKLLAS